MNFQISSFSEYELAYQKSIEYPTEFWSDIANTYQWRKKWNEVLRWDFTTPSVEWFINGKLNITENCLDRHLSVLGDQTALIWEPNSTEEEAKKYSYHQLFFEVCKMANVLKKMGVQKGDRVIIYMPMIPELTFAILACARIGAIHSVVFAGFSANSIADRIEDAQAKFIVTSDGMYRGNKSISVKKVVDEALLICPIVQSVLVVKRTGEEINMQSDRDFYYDDLYAQVDSNCDAEIMDSEDLLFILYTSGSTGKPKGVVHTCGGYMVYAGYTFANVFQYQPKEVHWCTADIGWITGHSYILYGPLLNGATTLLFEGVPTYPDAGRFWKIIDKYQVNIFYTAPTAIRSLMSYGTEWIAPYDLSSLKKIGSVGEPINEEAWHWYDEHIGKGKCPLTDTWWQTETGGVMIGTMCGIHPQKPSYAGYPMPGIQPILVDAEGLEIKENDVQGYLCIKFPWPSILRTTYRDHERCRINYFSTYPNLYFTGDGARRDENGQYRIIGRVDDVINVSGHRLGTAEIENAINEDEYIIESAVVGYPHDIKGQGIYAFVILSTTNLNAEKVKISIHQTIQKIIGPIAKPDKIQIVSGLPKTRSGKIMRRILRKIAEGELTNLGDTSTLLDPNVVDEIIKNRI